MNIFTPEPTSRASARALDDKRLGKAVLETAQILSTSVHLCNSNMGRVFGLYRPVMPSHPCTRWAAHSRTAFYWLCDYGIELSAEYEHRFGRIHKSRAVIKACWDCASAIPYVTETLPQPRLTQNSFLDLNESYRECLRRKWIRDRQKSRPARWTNRTPPQWATQELGIWNAQQEKAAQDAGHPARP